MTPLTPHFSLDEMIESNTAARLGIDNTPPASVIANLRRTCAGLEFVRQLLNSNAIHISSGYRSEPLERAITERDFAAWCNRRQLVPDADAWAMYFSKKQHPKGQAADFTCPTYGPPSRIIRAILNSGIEFDQLIAEYGEAGWVHISFTDAPRRQYLTIG